MKIAVIGCGNLGMSIVHGLLENKDLQAHDICATRRKIHLLKDLENEGVHVTSDNREATRLSEMIVIAVKPFNVQQILEEIGEVIDPEQHVVISVATGITLSQMGAWLNKPVPVYRAMPNIAADIKESVTCICQQGGTKATHQKVDRLFDSIGSNLHIAENLMEAATVLGACGVAFVMRFIRAMIQGGIEIGFDAQTANTIVNHTVKGAAQLLISNGEHPEQEIDKVTTPKGCTIVGLNEMEHRGFSSSLIRGIVASYERIEQ
jgi:pyrroline-5-carboxylate reductase